MIQFFLCLIAGSKSGAGDFELPDYWDDGEPLENREALPVCITYNMVSIETLNSDESNHAWKVASARTLPRRDNVRRAQRSEPNFISLLMSEPENQLFANTSAFKLLAECFCRFQRRILEGVNQGERYIKMLQVACPSCVLI